jgi:hypothetical protein
MNTQKRPELDLGLLTGTREEILRAGTSLVETFSVLVGKDLVLRDAPFGKTDCKTFIDAPLSDREGYVVIEHELSHVLFGTDLNLTLAYREKVVERLLQRAQIPVTSPNALPYKNKLDTVVHHLWNILEDHRCHSLWSELYPGGGRLLGERWHDIAKYEMEEHAKKDLLSYIGRYAAGTDTPDAPKEYQNCKPHIDKALNSVKFVNAEACLAVTTKLVDALADELLKEHRPPPPASPLQAQAQRMQSSQPQNSPQQANSSGQEEDDDDEEGTQSTASAAAAKKKEDALQKLKALTSAVQPQNSGKGHGDPEDNPLGGKDVELDPNARNKRPEAKQLAKIRRLLTAKEDDQDEEGKSSFERLLEDGAQQMQERLQEARQEMCRPKLDSEGEQQEMLSSYATLCGIAPRMVQPALGLATPSPGAAKIKAQLQKIRMKLRKRLADEGDEVDVEAYIEASINGELTEAKLYRHEKKESGLDLLLLCDVSGSMQGQGIEVLDRAIADITDACRGLRVNISVWCYSDSLFFFRKPGRIFGAPVIMGGTRTVEALDAAAEWARAARATRAIILLTDGMPTSLRKRKSTGSASGDLRALLDEIRKDKIVLSILGVQSAWGRVDFDAVFGPKAYGEIATLDDLPKAMAETARVLVEAHLKRTTR